MKKLSVFCILLLVGMSCVGLAIYSRSVAEAAQGTKGKEESSAVTVEVIRLTHKGFDPKHIKRTTGQFLVVFQNEKNQPLPAISLYTKQGLADRTAPLNDISSAKGQVFREEFLDLPVGDYAFVLPDGNERCTIRIDEKNKR
jgi:hypothetical protein